MSSLRRQPLLLTLLLAAVLLRGLLPLGTMPGQAADGGFSIVLCTAQGAVVQALDAGAPSADAGMDCPYGFALSMGVLPLPATADMPRHSAHQPPSALPARPVLAATRGAYPVRGPPTLV